MARETIEFSLTDAGGNPHHYAVTQFGAIEAAQIWAELLRITGVPLGQLFDALERTAPTPTDPAAIQAPTRADYMAAAPAADDSTAAPAPAPANKNDDADATTAAPAASPDGLAASIEALIASAPASALGSMRINGRLAGASLAQIATNVIDAGGPRFLMRLFRGTVRDGKPLIHPTTSRGTEFDDAYAGNLSELAEALFEVLWANYRSLFTRPPFLARFGEILTFIGQLRGSTPGKGT